MFCSHCGSKLADEVKFCSGCGKPVAPQATNAPPDNKALLVAEGLWGLPLKRGTFVCLKEHLVLRDQGYEFLRMPLVEQAIKSVNSKESSGEYIVNLQDTANDVIPLSEIKQIKIFARAALLRDQLTIFLSNGKKRDVHIPKKGVVEKVLALYPGLATK